MHDNGQLKHKILNYNFSENWSIVPSITTHDKEKIKEGKDQEMAQSERNSHSKNRGGKK